MGSWRKVGAFLGLVPDDSHQYDADGYEVAGYQGVGHDGAGHDGAAYESAGYDGAGYDRAEYRAVDQARADQADHHRAGYVAPGYQGGPEVAGHAGSSPYARDDADGHQAPSYRTDLQEAEPARTEQRNRRSGRRSFSAEPVTQGALAMKADQRRDGDSSTPARPASVKLTGFGEARIVGEKYRDGQSVILDMTGMSDADARRLVDFSAGLAFSLRGSIEKVAPKVFMLLPAEADIAGGSATALEDARAYVGSYAGR